MSGDRGVLGWALCHCWRTAGDDNLLGAVYSGGLLHWCRCNWSDDRATGNLLLDLSIRDLVDDSGSHDGASREGSEGESVTHFACYEVKL